MKKENVLKVKKNFHENIPEDKKEFIVKFITIEKDKKDLIITFFIIEEFNNEYKNK